MQDEELYSLAYLFPSSAPRPVGEGRAHAAQHCTFDFEPTSSHSRSVASVAAETAETSRVTSERDYRH